MLKLSDKDKRTLLLYELVTDIGLTIQACGENYPRLICTLKAQG